MSVEETKELIPEFFHSYLSYTLHNNAFKTKTVQFETIKKAGYIRFVNEVRTFNIGDRLSLKVMLEKSAVMTANKIENQTGYLALGMLPSLIAFVAKTKCGERSILNWHVTLSSVAQNKAKFIKFQDTRSYSVDDERILPFQPQNAVSTYIYSKYEDIFDYFDESILLTSLSQFDTWLGDFEGEFFIKKNQKIGFGATLTHTKALSDGYLDEAPQEFRAAIFANYQLDYKKWSMQLSARQELIDGQFIPFTPSFSINKNLGKNWSIKAKASHNYRLPTLNDKFWQPGGNPDLLPESGWSQEISTVFNYKNDHFKINTSVTGFNRTIQNWIFWSIESGQSFWSPRNITSVWSRGAEGRLDFTYQIKQVKIRLNGGYYYTHSTNQVALTLPRIPEGQQLFYTPIHQTNGTFSVQYKGFLVAYNHRWTSETLGLNDNLGAFDLGQFRFNYQLKWQKFKTDLLFNINNCWNANYYVVEYRPMARRHFQIGLSLYI